MDDIFYPLHSFKEQFSLEPKIINKEKLTKKKNVIICGMGGSAISVSLLHTLFPELSVTLHNDYGLPTIVEEDNTLIILNSYSGDTEEILDVLQKAVAIGASLATLSCGGELIHQSQAIGLPHIILPHFGLEPRFAIGHQIIGLLTLMGEENKIDSLKRSIMSCDVVTAENNGRQLASSLRGKYGMLYASKNLFPVAYLIKAAINEGSKAPCFVSMIPEADHNEIQGFISDEIEKENQNFLFVMFSSPKDNPRILKRFKIMSELYTDKGFPVAKLSTDHTDHAQVFELILTGYFAATYLAVARNVDSYKTPFIQEFKKRMAERQ